MFETNKKIYEFLFTVVISSVNGMITSFSEDVRVDLTNLSELGLDNTVIITKDIKWNFVVKRIGNDVSVFLKAIDELDYQVFVSIELIGFNRTAKPFVKHFDADFRREETSEFGSSQFISWNEFIDEKNKFIFNDKVSFYIKFSCFRRK